MKNFFAKFVQIISITALLTLLYYLWSGTTVTSNVLLMAGIALLVTLIFAKSLGNPILHPKKFIYLMWYVVFLFIEIIKSNIDVALRVIKRDIPLNPGIVAAKTKLKSSTGRMILANSITLTPGTLSVDLKDDLIYVHWIDIGEDHNEEEATQKIVAHFEKYLEVLFG